MRHNIRKVKLIPNLTPTTIIAVLGVSIFILIMLLPAFFELKKPKDAGPRAIMGDVSPVQSQIRETIRIENMEGDQGVDQMLVENMAAIIAILPNLEVS